MFIYIYICILQLYWYFTMIRKENSNNDQYKYIIYVILPPVIKRGNGNSTDVFPIKTSSYIFPLPRSKRVNLMLINMKFYGICSLVTASHHLVGSFVCIYLWAVGQFVWPWGSCDTDPHGTVEFVGTLRCPEMAYIEIWHDQKTWMSGDICFGRILH